MGIAVQTTLLPAFTAVRDIEERIARAEPESQLPLLASRHS